MTTTATGTGIITYRIGGEEKTVEVPESVAGDFLDLLAYIQTLEGAVWRKWGVWAEDLLNEDEEPL